MGTDVFWRIKVGIGEKPNGWDLADYVLAKFSEDDLPLIRQGEEKAAEAVEIMLQRGPREAMNRMNLKGKNMKKAAQEAEQTKKSEQNGVEA